MLGKDHVIVSEAVSLGFLTLTRTGSLKAAVPCLIGTAFGALLPDIDSVNSVIGRVAKPASTAIAHFGHRGFTHSLWSWLLLDVFSLTVLKGHWLMHLITSFGFIEMWLVLIKWMLAGYLLHLIEDSFSKAGVVWFFPFGHYRKWYPSSKYHYRRSWLTHKRKRVHLPPVYIRTRIHTRWRYKTGGKAERVIRSLAILVIIVELFIISR